MDSMLGIDLGTRYALAACKINDRVEVLSNRWGLKKTPSVVSWASEGWLAGEEAARREVAFPEYTYWDMKRHIACTGPIRCGRRTFSPEELLVPLLSLVREDAEATLTRFITSCVLTVPASFNFSQRQAVARAADKAGFEEIKIINEPTAAAFAYGKEGLSLILDFGAGTVDVSVVEAEQGIWQVLESVGDSCIGGREIDFLLARMLQKRLSLISKTSADSEALWRYLLGEAENIKVALSTCSSFTWLPSFGICQSSKPILIRREELERLMRPMLHKVVNIVSELWKKYSPQRLLLVGGSSRIPLLHSMLEERVARPDHLNQCPDEAVAIGAALFGASSEKRFLIDVLSQDLGIRSATGDFVSVLQKGSPLPCKASKRFISIANGSLDLHIMQGTSEGQFSTLNQVTIDFLSEKEEVELFFSVDSNGLLAIELQRKNGERIAIPDITVEECTLKENPVPPEIKDLEKRLARVSIALPSEQQGRLLSLFSSARTLSDKSIYGDAVAILEEMVREMERVSL